MRLSENSYAIGPSFHDWKREEWEVNEIARDTREEACKADFYSWERFAYCDRDKAAGRADIEEKMGSAIEMIFDNEQESKKFLYSLFSAYCSNDYIEALRTMLNQYLFKSFAIKWEYD